MGTMRERGGSETLPTWTKREENRREEVIREADIYTRREEIIREERTEEVIREAV